MKYGEYLNTNCFPLNKLAAVNDWCQTPNSQCFPVLIFLSTDGTSKYSHVNQFKNLYIVNRR